MPTLEQFLAATDGPRRSSPGPEGQPGYKIRCPHHQGDGQSLHVWSGEDGVGLKCFAYECDYRDILRSAGFAFERSSEIRPTATLRHPKYGSPSASWEIRDPDGRLFAVHVRWDLPSGKTFRWWKDGRWSLGGAKTADAPLYGADRLPSDRSIPVVLVEGEKARDVLAAAGHAAVGTVTGAASTPSAKSLSALQDRKVILWPDADEPGRAHMDKIARRLQGIASSIGRIEPTDLGLSSGGDAADLERIPAELPVVETESAVRRAVAVRLSEVAPEPVRFLWAPYLPLGKLTLVEGDPGDGKTWTSLAIAAAVSRGTALPEDPESLQAPGSVLFLTAEDGLGDTIRPRLDALGADCSRIVALTGWREGDREGALSLDDLPTIEAAVEKTRPALLIIDPIQGYLGAGVDMHRANQVRPLLSALGKMAETHQCAVLAIRHLRKSASDRAIQRGLGSIDFSAAARSILVVAPDPEDSQGHRRILAHAKSSTAATGSSIAFTLRPGQGFAWDGTSPLGADELLNASRSPRNVSASEKAEDFLRTRLAHGPVSSAVLRDESQAICSPRTLTNAKRTLGVLAEKTGFGTGSEWMWRLPDPKKKRVEPAKSLPFSQEEEPEPDPEEGCEDAVYY